MNCRFTFSPFELNCYFLFQADLFTLFYIWFPCCSCLKTMIRRSNSSSTKDSFIFRRQSTLRRSMTSLGGSRRQHLMENRRNFGSFQNETIREDSCEKQEENEKQLMQLEQILGKEISRGIQICCEQKSKTTETRIVRQSSCNDML